MVDNRLRIDDEDEDDEEEDGGGFSSKPRVSVERNRRSMKLSFSFIADGLSPKSKSLYTKLPSQPLNLSVLKLDGSSFDIEVTKTATIAELKEAVEAVFDHMPQKGPGKISWPHLWGHFCLCYDGQKLVTEADPIRNYGIKDGDQGNNTICLEMEIFIPSVDGYDQSDVPSASACLLLLLSIKKQTSFYPAHLNQLQLEKETTKETGCWFKAKKNIRTDIVTKQCCIRMAILLVFKITQDFMFFLEFKKLGHNEIDITDVQVWSLSQSNSCEEGEQKDKEDDNCSDIEKGKLQHYDKKDRCLIKPRKARIAHLLGGWFLCTRQATVKRKKVVGLACPSGMGTGLVGGFRKIIWFCRKKRNSRRDKWRED
uniref:SNRNP25 ubiquitin-like domain-containing protein n=1 Tax=Quercus lobata TaxID=97700 RepID=A0A7N2KU05_QUELO